MSRSLVSSLGRLALQGLQRLPSCFSGNLVRSWGGFPFLAISHSSNKPRQAGGQIQHFKCSNPDGPQTGVVGTPSEDHQTHKVRALTSCGLRSVVLLLLHVGTLGPLGDKTANVNPLPKQYPPPPSFSIQPWCFDEKQGVANQICPLKNRVIRQGGTPKENG